MCLYCGSDNSHSIVCKEDFAELNKAAFNVLCKGQLLHMFLIRDRLILQYILWKYCFYMCYGKVQFLERHVHG